MSKLEDAASKTATTSNGETDDAAKANEKKKETEKESPAKIFVGNIPTDLIGQNNLDEIFGPYGEIVGISMHQGYAFVLFRQEYSANDAIKGELDRIIAGRKIDICSANEAIERGKNVPSSFMRREMRRPLPPHPMMMMPFRRDLPPPPIGMMPGPLPMLPVKLPPPVMKSPLDAAKMDMEAKVICSERHPRLLSYAQMLNHRIKRLGLGCDIFFLDPLTSHEMAINRAAKDGVLYVVFAAPENEMHLSVTLYILHGQAQEHRNMPMDDCFKLVAANFDKYLRTLKKEVETKGEEEEPASGGIIGDIDPSISLLLLNLAEGKAVNLKQIDQVLNYTLRVRDSLTGSHDASRFQEILERLKHEDLKPIQPPEPKTDPKQQANDLQAKIKQLFGDTSKQLSTVGVPNPLPPTTQPPKPAASTAKKASFDFTNPSVQDALKKLLRSSTNILTKVRKQPTTSPDKTSDYQHGGKKQKLSVEAGSKIPTIGQSYQPPPPPSPRPKAVAEQQIPTLQGRRKSPKRDKKREGSYERELTKIPLRPESPGRNGQQRYGKEGSKHRYPSPGRAREYSFIREQYALQNENKERQISPSREKGRYVSPSADRKRYLSPERERYVIQNQERKYRVSPSRERERYVSPNHGSRERERYVSPNHVSRERERYVSPNHGSRERERYVSPNHGSRERERYVSPNHGSRERERYVSPNHGRRERRMSPLHHNREREHEVSPLHESREEERRQSPSDERMRRSSPGRSRRGREEYYRNDEEYRYRERGREKERQRSRESSRERHKRAKPGRPTIAGFF